MQKDNLVLRGKVVDFDKNLFGIFLVVIERAGSNNIFYTNAILGKSQFISIFDMGNPPLDELVKSMTDLLLRGEATISDSKKLENILIKNKNLIMKLLEQEDMGNTLHMALTSRLNLFFEAQFQVSVESHMSAEPYEYHDMISEIALKFSYDETNSIRKQFALPNDVDIIKLDPYLSVHGSYTMSLTKGDLIYCTPKPDILENKILLQHYELLGEQGELKKLIGTIEFIRPSQDSLIFVVQTNPSLYGILEVGNNVLIEVPVLEEIDNTISEELDDLENINAEFSFSELIEKITHNPVYIVSCIIIVIILIIFLYGGFA